MVKKWVNSQPSPNRLTVVGGTLPQLNGQYCAYAEAI